MTDDPSDIRAWQRLSPRITTSGRLLPGDATRLASIGVRQVVNLALDDHPEALPDEAGVMAKHGIAYRHIPVPFDRPTQAHFNDFSNALDAAGDAPVHVHCIANWRVSAFFYLRHRAAGMPKTQARGLMQQQWDPLGPDGDTYPTWRALLTG